MDIKVIAQSGLPLVKKSEEAIRSGMIKKHGSTTITPASIHKLGDSAVMLGRNEKERFVLVIADHRGVLPDGFHGEAMKLDDGGVALVCPLDAGNAAALRRHFPWCAPRSLRRERATIGCGDRLGLATCGQLQAVRTHQILPVLAQQSMRELAMTGRTFQQVVDDATFMVFECDYRDGYGADGDHLKNIADIDVALDAGMPMITLDLSEVMNAAAADWSAEKVNAAFEELPAALRKIVTADYADQKFLLEGGMMVHISAQEARRCAVMYTRALDFDSEFCEHLRARRGDEFDLEISIDETTAPTLPEHHLFIVRELLRREVEFISLAPRFVGEFQKAIDYIGDVAEFERQFAVHAAIADTYGGYRISVHSGSDKFSIFPVVGRLTNGRFHLKTAGTSWLEAVAVIAENDPGLYRRIHRCAVENFREMLKLYHITADISRVPDPAALEDNELPALLVMPEARQLLHITYGPILRGELRSEFFAAMHRFEKAYNDRLARHFEKHLRALGVPLRK